MGAVEIDARIRASVWGTTTQVVDLERSQLEAAKRKSFPDGFIIEATTQQ